MVNVPVFVCLLSPPLLAYYLSSVELIPIWGIGAGFILGFAMAWIAWSILITKWRIWAFKNVRNVHELKKRAIQEKLIWKDGKIFEKTEIRTLADKEELKKIEKKFEKADFYKEDNSLPPQQKIYYSKSLGLFEFIISILLLGAGIYFVTIGTTKNYILGGVLILIGIYGSTQQLRRLLNKKPQLIIGNKGIETISVEFKKWSAIKGEEVIQEGSGKSSKSYLVFWYDNDQYEKLEIEPLNTTRKKLENSVRTYRIRNTKNYHS